MPKPKKTNVNQFADLVDKVNIVLGSAGELIDRFRQFRHEGADIDSPTAAEFLRHLQASQQQVHLLTPYQTLGIAHNATDADIKSRYRQLCKIYHPDKGAGDGAMFARINNAYEEIKKERGIK